jgi:hypothetical protein
VRYCEPRIQMLEGKDDVSQHTQPSNRPGYQPIIAIPADNLIVDIR